MTAFLKIENPGVAPTEAFTLLGASTKRGSEAIGKFGTGNKHGVNVLLRHGMGPTVFADRQCMEFGTRKHEVDGHEFNHVQVVYSGGSGCKNRTDDLGFVLEYGEDDWAGVELALREFVSNSIDRAVEEAEREWMLAQVIESGIEMPTEEFIKSRHEMLKEWRKTARPWESVVVEVVNANQVRAKRGHTRVFVPLNEQVLGFYNNLGRWFLHFSEPELLHQSILPKANRNLGDRKAAVIYRRGVRVREFESSEIPSLFDYNLENLKLDESRRVDDWYVQIEAARAVAGADESVWMKIWQAFLDGKKFWEQGFDNYGLTSRVKEGAKEVWTSSFRAVVGNDAVIATVDGGQQAARKGYKVLKAPEAFVTAAGHYGVLTPDKVLSDDDKEGRTILDSTPDAEAAVDQVWDAVTRLNLTNGKERPLVKTFRKVMDAGSQTLGFYRDGVVHINQDIAGNGSLTLGWHGLSQQLVVTALEEVVHHVTQAGDSSRDFQDYILNLAVYLLKQNQGIV